MNKCMFFCLIILTTTLCTVFACAAPAAAPTAQVQQPVQSQPSAPAQVAVKPAIQIIMAEMWLQVSDNASSIMEGPAFDRDGKLYFVDISGRGRVYVADPSTKAFKLIYEDGKSNFAAAKIHKDGRIFLCGYIDNNIVIMKPDGTILKEIRPVYKEQKLIPDDMVFDGAGNFYFTSYDKASATGGIYRMSADLSDLTLIVSNLDRPNGISMSPDGKQIWISETVKKLVHRYELESDGTVNTADPKKSAVFSIPSSQGGFPDSNQTDSAGNLYQGLFGGACLVVFNSQGDHVATVKLPDSDVAKYYGTTNLTFSPGSDLGYLMTSGSGGGRIYTFKGLAKGNTLYSHQ
ncbi:MAG: SMP-30/gluconolactonase/LRE family protein [Chloroflexi bacterium]|nr:SMP-30/gluconolactonase/LRE family protein [Chloroflexota bacterium]